VTGLHNFRNYQQNNDQHTSTLLSHSQLVNQSILFVMDDKTMFQKIAITFENSNLIESVTNN
jgi:hypothetical protein